LHDKNAELDGIGGEVAEDDEDDAEYARR